MTAYELHSALGRSLEVVYSAVPEGTSPQPLSMTVPMHHHDFLAHTLCVCRAGAAAGGGSLLWGPADARQQGPEGERQQLPGL